MAKYMAEQMERMRLDYKTIFMQERWKKYKDEVDKILIENNHEDLIVEC